MSNVSYFVKGYSSHYDCSEQFMPQPCTLSYSRHNDLSENHLHPCCKDYADSRSPRVRKVFSHVAVTMQRMFYHNSACGEYIQPCCSYYAKIIYFTTHVSGIIQPCTDYYAKSKELSHNPSLSIVIGKIQAEATSADI